MAERSGSAATPDRAFIVLAPVSLSLASWHPGGELRPPRPFYAALVAAVAESARGTMVLRSTRMIDPHKSIHISPVGANWEVESEAGPLGQADTKQEAMELGRELATASGAERITVHGADGQVEQEFHLNPEVAGT